MTLMLTVDDIREILQRHNPRILDRTEGLKIAAVAAVVAATINNDWKRFCQDHTAVKPAKRQRTPWKPLLERHDPNCAKKIPIS